MPKENSLKKAEGNFKLTGDNEFLWVFCHTFILKFGLNK